MAVGRRVGGMGTLVRVVAPAWIDRCVSHPHDDKGRDTAFSHIFPQLLPSPLSLSLIQFATILPLLTHQGSPAHHTNPSIGLNDNTALSPTQECCDRIHLLCVEIKLSTLSMQYRTILRGGFAGITCAPHLPPDLGSSRGSWPCERVGVRYGAMVFPGMHYSTS